MNAPRENEVNTDTLYEQIQSAVNHLDPGSDLGEIEWILYQFARLDFGPADDPLLNFIRKSLAEEELLRNIKRTAKVSMRVLRAALICQQERVARHRRKMEGSTK